MSSRRPPLAERVPLPRPETQGDGALYRSFLDWDWRVRGRKLQKWHHYFDIYERHLSRFRGTDCHLLEFGVMDGGSLFMWREFLGPGARITAVDIDPRTLQFNGLLPDVTVVTGDQADQAVLDRIVAEHGPFDIAIDDGGHTARQQINTFNGIYASVAGDGVYICEDTHTSYWPEYQDAGPQTTMIEHAKKLVDEMHSVYRAAKPSRFSVPMAERQGDIAVSRFAASTYSIQFYDSMIVFEKRPRAEPWSEFR
jgi:cephalosporin hydroxylase